MNYRSPPQSAQGMLFITNRLVFPPNLISQISESSKILGTGNGKFPTHADRKAVPERSLGGSVLLDVANADLDKSRTREDRILPRSLGYTVEECTCQDCVKSKPKVDSDHVFPLPAMEEGATILVTTKTNDYCKSLPAASGVTGTERSTSTR
uniref:tumor necrosis factor receptor superfamily member 17 isoform X3 n=1 Tax=Ictidomys tridecemlineatus TaxID=43179 RepID=UPI001A9E8964|nr:tumor necrosis factor receptor superfamily member 17 isoform X3 [Ictidomys tridecemlineatus]